MRERTIDTTDPQYAEVREHDEVVDRNHWVDPSRIVSLLAGIAFLVLGAIVLLDTGFDGFPSAPVAEVAGFTHTPLIGVIELGLGILLLAGAADWSRGLSSFTGALMVAGGLVVALGTERLPDSLATDSEYGWMLALVGAVVLIVDLAMPTVGRRERMVRATH